jgi:hypothetical protein
MKAGFKIDNSYHLVCETGFFYLWNFNYDNSIALVNFSKEQKKYKHYESCVGMWKVKQLKK